MINQFLTSDWIVKVSGSLTALIMFPSPFNLSCSSTDSMKSENNVYKESKIFVSLLLWKEARRVTQGRRNHKEVISFSGNELIKSLPRASHYVPGSFYTGSALTPTEAQGGKHTYLHPTGKKTYTWRDYATWHQESGAAKPQTWNCPTPKLSSLT